MKCSHADEADTPPPLPSTIPTHPAPPLFSPPSLPYLAALPAGEAAPRSIAALAAAAALLRSVCLLPGQPPPHGNDATRPAGEALQLHLRLPRSHLLELFRKEGGIGARSAPRGFSLSLSSLSLREDVKAKGGRDHDLSPGSGVGVEVSCLCTTCF